MNLFKFKTPKQVRILFLGLDNAGKTTILKVLTDQSRLAVTPTCGFNIKYLSNQNFKIQVWDVGGQRAIRGHWVHFYRNCQAIVYVVDSGDSIRFQEAALQLFKLLTFQQLAGIPILILANKQDLNSRYEPEQLLEQLRLSRIYGRQWSVVGCSGKTGEGVQEGIQWLLEQMQSKG